VIDHYLGLRGPDGLVGPAEGWNTLDWVPSWESGIPPDGDTGVSGVINAQFAYALRLAAELETFVGEPEMAARARRLCADLFGRIRDAFWDDERGLLADDRGRAHFSEHLQCLALLGADGDERLLPAAERERIADGLLRAPDLARTTIYFTHYLFETFRLLGRPDALLDRLGLWFDLKTNGLKTTVEMPEPTRSDCHAWGAHPVFHFYATLLGVRPAAPGFAEVTVAPQLGPLDWARGTMPHPRGEIVVDVRRTGEPDGVEAQITLPEGVTGTFRHGGRSLPLRPGAQTVTLLAGAASGEGG
jgi:hypothetical protein